jgi:succinate dehydrogenase/fumarate reductase flavoprotein subunit
MVRDSQTQTISLIRQGQRGTQIFLARNLGGGGDGRSRGHHPPPIPGLFAAGEIVGGLYYHNYASGTGLVAGVVFGRLAGAGAARFAAGLTGS